MTSDERIEGTEPMSEARQAAERAARSWIGLWDGAETDHERQHIEALRKHILTEFAPLLAAKDTERDRLAEQVEWLRYFLSTDGVRKWWRFDDNQQPLSSWHEREDFIARITAALTEQPNE